MKPLKSSLKSKILFYLVLFSGLILFFLWVFQILFLDYFYEYETKKTLNKVKNSVISSYESNDYISSLDYLSYYNNVCIELSSKEMILYSSDAMKRGCIVESKRLYKNNFESKNIDFQIYKIKNEILNNYTLVYSIKLADDVYAYINTSIEPIDSTIEILKKQFIYVTLGVLIISVIIAFYISKKISKPIVAMNESARKLAKGKYEPFNIKTDIEEVNELVETLNYASKELSRTDELRKDLMANVSHDLKTPLTMIRAYAEMSKDLDIENKDKVKNNLNIIIEESERLNILVNDILDLSVNESNINSLKIEEFDIVKLIKIILKRYNIYKESEGYNFIFKNKQKIIIHADKAKIEQVIYNLINNAINYTGKDKKVEIKLRFIGSNLKVSIIDTGKGIEKEELNNIWQKYYKVSKKYKRNVIGTGLGLSIVKTILEKHKFKYGVNSEKNKGTEFYFEIDKNNIE